MADADVLARIAAARPRVAAELERPHAEEALLAGVVLDLLVAGALDPLPAALGCDGRYERCVLWGADPETGAEDLTLAAALHAVAPGAGRAALLEAEPDLVVVTEDSVVAVDATVGRPGHAAARARRGEPVPPRLLDGVQQALERHGVRLSPADVAMAYAPARLAAVTLALANALGRRAVTVALAGRAVDLLRPDRDDARAWSDAAAVVLRAAGTAPLQVRALSWLQVADRLAADPRTAAAVARIRSHPTLAPGRGKPRGNAGDGA
ncbi:MAG TPA: hypothetical protein VNA20_03775 [Frankiaceae bacterium]|nr:hypothetical protein [Frankiaceae bacterium]